MGLKLFQPLVDDIHPRAVGAELSRVRGISLDTDRGGPSFDVQVSFDLGFKGRRPKAGSHPSPEFLDANIDEKRRSSWRSFRRNLVASLFECRIQGGPYDVRYGLAILQHNVTHGFSKAIALSRRGSGFKFLCCIAAAFKAKRGRTRIGGGVLEKPVVLDGTDDYLDALGAAFAVALLGALSWSSLRFVAQPAVIATTTPIVAASLR